MNHLRRIRRLLRFLGALAMAMLGLVVSAPLAFAMRVPASGGSSSATATTPASTVTHTVVAGGMAGWQVAVIVAAVAVLAATIAIVVDRARAARRAGMLPAA
jgi:Flp pilus assembly protein TadD